MEILKNFTEKDGGSDHHNLCPIMVAIYSYSKHLMNKAFFLLDDFGIKTEYSDTDSMIINVTDKG